ncbi:MAG: M48 family metallopeptidase [Candidatus Binatia bacterium]|nr:M48 family metallopeptidase [Candidatus Binatia bacterium]
MEERKYLRADPQLEAYLDGIAARLLPSFGLDASTVQLRVVEDPFLNAFALPNGTLVISDGLLAQLDNEAQLACVLAHELTHFVERHAYARRVHDAQALATAQGSLPPWSSAQAASSLSPGHP